MDEFDLALTEALNEAVPPADFATNLADRLVTRTRRRARFWKTLFVLVLCRRRRSRHRHNALVNRRFAACCDRNFGRNKLRPSRIGRTGRVAACCDRI